MPKPNEAKIALSAENRTAAAFTAVQAQLGALEARALKVNGAFGLLARLTPLTAVLGGAGFVAIAKAANDGVDALNDLADATGASIENLSALEDIAVRTGTGVDTAGDAVVKLNKALLEANDKESPAAKALQGLGLSIKELQALDPVDALQKLAEALAGFEDNGAKGRYTLALLGRGVRELAPLLNDLAEAGKLQATTTTEQAKEAEKLNKEFFALQKNTVDAARAITGPFVKALNDLIEQFRNASKEGKGFFDSVKEIATRSLNETRLREVNKWLQSRNISEAQRNDLLRQQAELQAKVYTLDSKAGPGRGFIIPDLVKPSLPELGGDDKKTVAKVSEYQRYVETLTDAILATRDLSAEEKLETEISRGHLKVTAQQAEHLRQLARAAELLKLQFGEVTDAQEAFRRSELEANEATVKALRDAQDDQERANRERLGSLLSQTPKAQLDAALSDIEFLNKAFDAGKVSAEQWADAVRLATGRLSDGAKEATDDWTVFAEQAARNIQDALGDTLTAAMQGDFQSIGKMWVQLIDRMVAEALGAQLGKALFGDFGKSGDMGGWVGEAAKSIFGSGGGTAGGGDWVGEIAKWAGTFFGGGMATGGDVRPGTTYLVGESGPELLTMGSQGGRITPNDRLTGAGGGKTVVINQTFHFHGPAPSRQDRTQIMAEIGLATQRALARNT